MTPGTSFSGVGFATYNADSIEVDSIAITREEGWSEWKDASEGALSIRPGDAFLQWRAVLNGSTDSPLPSLTRVVLQ
jgi:hypothetical protein